MTNSCSKVLEGKMVQFIACKVSCTTTCIREKEYYTLVPVCVVIYIYREVDEHLLSLKIV